MYRDILASLALGILLDAFAVRTLLVPTAAALLGRWNWWPSRHGAARPGHGPAAAGTAPPDAAPPDAAPARTG